MSRGSSQLTEMENELYGRGSDDHYVKDLERKMEQRKKVSNLLESKDQAQISRFGGEMLSQSEVA